MDTSKSPESPADILAALGQGKPVYLPGAIDLALRAHYPGARLSSPCSLVVNDPALVPDAAAQMLRRAQAQYPDALSISVTYTNGTVSLTSVLPGV